MASDSLSCRKSFHRKARSGKGGRRESRAGSRSEQIEAQTGTACWPWHVLRLSWDEGLMGLLRGEPSNTGLPPVPQIVLPAPFRCKTAATDFFVCLLITQHATHNIRQHNSANVVDRESCCQCNLSVLSSLSKKIVQEIRCRTLGTQKSLGHSRQV